MSNEEEQEEEDLEFERMVDFYLDGLTIMTFCIIGIVINATGMT